MTDLVGKARELDKAAVLYRVQAAHALNIGDVAEALRLTAAWRATYTAACLVLNQWQREKERK